MNIIKLIVVLITLTFYGNLYSHDVTEGKEPLKVDMSGMMVEFGGQLINKRQSLFCTHWDLLGKEVVFIARNGERVKRTVVKMDKLGVDVCILTFDEDLDLKQHWVAPVADIKGDTIVTIFRYMARTPIIVEVESDFFYKGPVTSEYNTFKCMPGRSIRPGDSGKGWYTTINGKIHLVGINSYITFNWRGEIVRGFSAEVGEIYSKYQKELKKK
tara:strand:+ start:1757 stop:2398 length:642 start_codon:yes stop_codon:yes gene_type:complete